jgi:hypothetical protein
MGSGLRVHWKPPLGPPNFTLAAGHGGSDLPELRAASGLQVMGFTIGAPPRLRARWVTGLPPGFIENCVAGVDPACPPEDRVRSSFPSAPSLPISLSQTPSVSDSPSLS